MNSSSPSQLHIDPEFKSLIPPLSTEERDGLEQSILAEGVRDPVVVWNGTIVDGHNRVSIASGQNGNGEVFDYPTVYRDFPDRTAAKLWIIENQMEQRRNLSDADKIDLAETKREILEVSRGRPPKSIENSQNSDEYSDPNDRRTDAKVGNAAGVSRDTVAKYRKVKEFGDSRILDGLKNKQFSMDNAYHLSQVGQKCGEGTYSVLWEHEDEDAKVRYSTPQLKHLLKVARTGNEDDVTAELVELVESDTSSSVFEAHKVRERERQQVEWERRREEKRKERQAAPMPERRFEVLLVDPPWPYSFSETESRRVENQYPTMSLEEIKAVDVPAEDDSVLFMWATSPKLTEAIEVMEAWGYSYRTSLVWVKDKIGMGYYARQQHELVLLGKKGNPPVPEPSSRPPSVFSAPRREHSSKPEILYQLIEQMYPEESKVELFARNTRSGWQSWGNEALDNLLEVAS